MGKRHAAGLDAVEQGDAHRSVTLRGGDGLRGGGPASARGLAAVSLPNAGLWESWQRVSNGIPEGSFLNCVREDPIRKGLLYACTEKGVYVSFDDGGAWQPLQLNLPVTSVRDLVVHDDDLVIATFGRSFWIL